MTRFLLARAFLDRRKTRVGWDEVTRLKHERGLGLRRLIEYNKAATLKHIWHLLIDKEGNIWSKCVHTNFLRGRSFWHVEAPSSTLRCGGKFYPLGTSCVTLLRGEWVMGAGFSFGMILGFLGVRLDRLWGKTSLAKWTPNQTS